MKIHESLVLDQLDKQRGISLHIYPLERDYFDENYEKSHIQNQHDVNAYNAAFAKCLETIKRRHDPVVTTVAQGIIELKQKWQLENPGMDQHGVPLPLEIQTFLDRFYMSRIGIKLYF
jgi:pyruvate dehydrogenase kinase 2/3/4